MGLGLIFKIVAYSFIWSTSFFSVIFSTELGAEPPSKKVRAAVAPYLVPSDHPIKGVLDVLFTTSRVILNLDTLHKAGFAKTSPNKFTRVIVTAHPAIPGYVFKLYLDAQRDHKNMPESHYWLLRCT